jgi:hypothetical protein
MPNTVMGYVCQGTETNVEPFENEKYLYFLEMCISKFSTLWTIINLSNNSTPHIFTLQSPGIKPGTTGWMRCVP